MAKSHSLLWRHWDVQNLARSSSRPLHLREYGKITRVIFTGASDGDLTKPEENAGIIESFRISFLTIPSRDTELAKGYWPSVAEVQGKYVLQFVEPTAETWKKVGAIVLDSLATVGDCDAGRGG